jgi:hypothetical protein
MKSIRERRKKAGKRRGKKKCSTEKKSVTGTRRKKAER